MKAVLLAAGKGTRLGELTRERPKPMIEVAGKPLAEYVIRGIIDAGVSEFVLVTRYLAEKIVDYFGDGSSMGVSISYSSQGERYGTGAALLDAYPYVGDDSVLMTYADIVVSPHNYKGAVDTFVENDCDAVVTLNYTEDPWAGAAVVADERGRIIDIIEKPPKGQSTSNWNSAGLFVFKPVVFDYLKRLKPSARGEYEIPDAVNAMVADGLKVCAYYLTGSWRDVGTPEDIPMAAEILTVESSKE